MECRRPVLPCFAWFLTLLVGFAVPLPAQDLTIGGFSSLQPWAQTKPNQEGSEEVVGGIIKEIADQIAKATGVRFRYYFPPRRRMELEIAAGRLDVLPMANPAWLQKPELLNWSSPIIVDRSVLVTLAKEPITIRGPSDVKGLTIGMQAGFLYPELSESWGFVREDADTVARNLAKLDLGRIEVVYASEIDVRYRLKGRPGTYTIQPWSPGESVYHWAVAKSAGEQGRRVLDAAQAFTADGTIARILASHR